MNMQFSALSVAFEIRQTRNERHLSVVPFMALLTNSAVWSAYGWFKGELPVLLPNLAGTVSGLTCVLLYHRFSMFVIPLQHIAISMTVVLGALYCIYGLGDIEAVGYLGCFLAIFMFASPLVTLGRVIRERSTRSMPFYTSFSGWLNSLSWSLYGLLVAHDFMVYGPNLAGFALSSFQLLLYVVYGFDSREEDKVR